jgi:DHA1 family bicyclomycin/chloramphenicol resistance-like MFS transporter
MERELSKAPDSEAVAAGVHKSPRAHIAVLASLFIIGPFALQVFLPALPDMEADLKANASQAALAVSLATMAFAIASLMYGGLADKLGRRPTILIGMCLLTIGSLVCATAPNIGVLLCGRVLQSAGGAAALVAGRAIVVDTYEGRSVMRVMSWMFTAMTLAPILATPVGGVIVDIVGWRGNFLTVALVAALTVLVSFFFLPETRGEHHASRTESVRLLEGGFRLLRSKTYMGFVTNHALQMAANTTFLASVGILLAEQHGMSSTSIGLVYVVGGVMLGLGSYASTRLPKNAFPLILGAAVVAFAAGIVAVILAERGVWAVSALILPAAIISCVYGFTGPTVQAGAVSAIPGMQGMASGMLMFLSSVVTAAMVQLAASLSDGSPLPLAAIMTACCLGAVASLVLAYKRGNGAARSSA